MAESTNLGGIHAELDARTRAFDRKMDRSAGRLSAWAKKARAAGNAAVRYGGMAAAAAVGGVSVMVAKTLASVDSLAKQADAASMNITRLQAMQQAATLTGVSQATLSKAIARSNRNVGEAVQGIGAAARWLDIMGVKAEALKGQAPDQTFAIISERIRQMDSAQERAAASAAFFGDRTAEMLPLIMKGGEFIDAAEKRIAEYGATVNRVDAAKIEMANDSLAEAKVAASGVATVITKSLAPMITIVAQKFTDAASASGGFGKQVEGVANFAIDAAGFLADAWQGVNFVWESGKLSVALLNEVAARGFRSTARGVIWLREKAGAAWDWIAASGRVSWELIRHASTSVITFIMDKLAMVIGKMAEAGKTIGDKLAGSGVPGLEKIGASISRVSAGVQNAAANVRSGIDQVQGNSASQLEAAKQGMNTARAALFADVDTSTPILDKLVRGTATTAADAQTKFNEVKTAELASSKLKFEMQTLMADIQRRAESSAATANANVGGQAGQAPIEEHPEVVAEKTKMQRLQELARQHEGTLTGIRYEGLAQREKFLQMSGRQQVATVVGDLEQMTRGVAQHNKVMFRINQVAGITQAIMNAHEAFTMNLAKYPGPLGMTMGGIALAAGLARAAAIAKTKFNGGGGSSPSTAGSGGGVPAQQAPDYGQPQGGAAPATSQTARQQLLFPSSGMVHTEEIVKILNEAQEQGMMIGGAGYA